MTDSQLPPQDDREARLADVLQRMLDSSATGETVRLETVIGEHPDLENDLRELWATAQVADVFGQAAGSAPPVNTDSSVLGALRSAMKTAGETPLRVGDYELIEEIGRGGMGVVFKARQISLSRTVALKMILRGELASPEELSRFRAEAEAAARLEHPNIVPVYEVGEHEGRPFFSMRYIDGTTLSKQLIEGPLSNREAAELLEQVCDAISHAHAEGLLHRDIKPSNILIDEQGRPYVTDFGLAKRIESNGDASRPQGQASLTASGAILGTPSYMAPEQAAAQRGELSERTDVYSLGAVLYAMLTGRPPFQSSNPVDIMLMVLEQDPLPPRLLNQSADADLEMVSLKCLQKPGDLRYDSVANLQDDLRAVINHEPPGVRSSHFTQVLSRAFRETHHAGVLENWGLLWMWHSLVLCGLCVITNVLQLLHVQSRLPYVGVWVFGLSIWAQIFWGLRRRSGPVTFVERQIAHVWAASISGTIVLFMVEAVMQFPVLTLSPILAIVSAMVFMCKAGILSGAFYIQMAVLSAAAVGMAASQKWSAAWGVPDFSLTIFGLVSAGCFFFPGLKYYRQRARRNAG